MHHILQNSNKNDDDDDYETSVTRAPHPRRNTHPQVKQDGVKHFVGGGGGLRSNIRIYGESLDEDTDDTDQSDTDMDDD
eukprot:CAMPEP_0114354648 /NCGR_PEP_ID=MMETSP0101-20121206/19630_1 /TAXON_ID=38822 ORGANISM="Pteridomonas danica, Strain PT" /NCGR_SAMPLE_ID=MMETSP0101 /ASSEMBLY_ACC=CAM_ASM_000211 /LENGTH=78 /DNA_ID=CAMNT_0001496207 /DNA_START=164 /DNA_END=400 /DNA_ORIENTATION=-